MRPQRYDRPMCGRYTIRRVDLLIRHGAMPPPPFEEFSEHGTSMPAPRFNVAPSQSVPVVRLDASDARKLGIVKWGLVPSWVKGKPKLTPINARAETLASSRMFRPALERRRCLVPADGFYEWMRLDERTKQPMFIRLKDDAPFCFAGLWERWKPDDSAAPIDTVTIVTTTPNPLMASIHDRMPVILPASEHGRWLDRSIGGDGVLDLLVPFDADRMEAWPVSKRVNSPRNDDASLVDPSDEPA